MYAQFFGFNQLPFRLRPDAEYLYPGVDYSRARTRLLAGLKERSRVWLVLGHPGLGKTTLVDDVLKGLGADGAICRINQPQISAQELLQALILQVGTSIAEADSATRSYAELVGQIDAIGARSTTPVLMVDDAHLLPPSTAMAFTEILTRAPNIKILLSGRSGVGVEEMAVRFLAGEEPRIVRLGPLNLNETQAYIDRRLAVAGARNRELFAPEALTLIFQHTAGAPRLINVLCDAALHTACLRASGQVSTSEIIQATQDPRWAEAVTRDRPRTGPMGREVPVPEPQIDPAPSAVAAQLVLSVGDQALSKWPLKPGRLTIGRAADNDLRLDTRFISRHHCQVTTTGTVSTIEDLASVNGIIVNGREVKRHVLKHSDQIQLGDHTLTYLVR